jgi:hypothetical protein
MTDSEKGDEIATILKRRREIAEAALKLDMLLAKKNYKFDAARGAQKKSSHSQY